LIFAIFPIKKANKQAGCIMAALFAFLLEKSNKANLLGLLGSLDKQLVCCVAVSPFTARTLIAPRPSLRVFTSFL
jgi:hypothetical protein